MSLTSEEKLFLSEHAGSEIVRVVKKAITSLKDQQYNKLLACPSGELLLVQGELRGLQAALNLFEVITAQVKSAETRVTTRPKRPLPGLPSSSD